MCVDNTVLLLSFTQFSKGFCLPPQNFKTKLVLQPRNTDQDRMSHSFVLEQLQHCSTIPIFYLKQYLNGQSLFLFVIDPVFRVFSP